VRQLRRDERLQLIAFFFLLPSGSPFLCVPRMFDSSKVNALHDMMDSVICRSDEDCMSGWKRSIGGRCGNHFGEFVNRR
jgi:hypothetical protein